MSPAETKAFIKEAFTKVIEDVNASDEIYAKYFSQDYIQYVDGKTLSFSDFVKHMKVQKEVVQSVAITFKHMLVEGDKVATVHMVNAIKKDGGIIEAQVNAVFQIRDNKIILCDELTHLIKGEESDRDLGSRH